MKHLLFPTVAQADAFVQDLQAQGVIQPEVGQTTLNRRGSAGMATDTTTRVGGRDSGHVDGGTAEDAGDGALAGTGVGAAVGAAAGAVATVATGGLAAPLILGMAALGSGVGAGVGAIGGAAGVDETGDGYRRSYEVEDSQYDRMSSGMSGGGRAIAVDDSVPADVVSAAAARHGGEFV
jgi:hypothetical protein